MYLHIHINIFYTSTQTYKIYKSLYTALYASFTAIIIQSCIYIKIYINCGAGHEDTLQWVTVHQLCTIEIMTKNLLPVNYQKPGDINLFIQFNYIVDWKLFSILIYSTSWKIFCLNIYALIYIYYIYKYIARFIYVNLSSSDLIILHPISMYHWSRYVFRVFFFPFFIF